ncbi:3-hydroxyacyl-CoA dehydrogenase [Croceicoccus ponticola]|uniref:3-hydroxyacyl-CoA dehydrogenase n=1 Tax=Croceicoccus ponticola TaxID=2217664 RepID=A0A437H293_9SPHN|nr:3-hydroxyacyl-CoA dehydrogenase NAD-binding domain-containing protein [Croceicoccus ponticola]RVQ69666.1 3-hydroxyacyl-CoA dehydrogenase [Croceicoccus ponticola]
MTIETRKLDNGLLLIVAENPPVNAINAAIRQGLVGAIEQANGSDDVVAIVLSCKGRTFFAGADIKEFGNARKEGPTLHEVCQKIAHSTKPVVAALHGTVLGGGLEIALACHGRVAVEGTTCGLPESQLGLIPGAGGTNRLARLIGPKKALEFVVSGKQIGAARAEKLGVLDEVVAQNEVAAAISCALRMAQRGRFKSWSDDFPADFVVSTFEDFARKLTQKMANQDAPAACVRSVQRAMTMPFEEAIAADREEFARLSAGNQSLALRHAFFAERAAAKPKGFDIPGPVKSISKVTVIGAGTMGTGIAMSFTAGGIPATLIDTTQEALDRGLDRVRNLLATSARRGSISEEQAEQRLALLQWSRDIEQASDADLVIEAVYEDLAIKQDIITRLDALCDQSALIATNTSAIDIDLIAKDVRNRDRFVGLHFFAPANVMRLVEVVLGKETSAETIAASLWIAKKIGKVPVLSGNCDGFIGNRMVAKRGAQVDRLLLEGALPQDVDESLKCFGFPMGPLAINDMSGLDVGYAIRKRRGTPFPIADAVVEHGRLGQKTGAGYYRYEDGNRTPLPDPEIENLIASVSNAHGITRRTFSPDEMVARMIYPLVNEGARILEEGIALRASDIDAVWLNGYGFPRWRGGPMFHADSVGLSDLTKTLRDLARLTGDNSLTPAPLLNRLVADEMTFTDLDKENAEK